MTPTDMIPILTEWRDLMQRSEADIERYLRPLGLTPESPLYNISWSLMDAYTKAVSAQVGDQDDWLAWYWADNDMGAKKREAMIGGKYRKIKTLRDLARAIEESNREP